MTITSCEVLSTPQNHSVCFCHASGILSGAFHRHDQHTRLLSMPSSLKSFLFSPAQFCGVVHIRTSRCLPLVQLEPSLIPQLAKRLHKHVDLRILIVLAVPHPPEMGDGGVTIGALLAEN